MNKIFLSIGMLLYASIACLAQDKGYIAISGGASIPMGKFAGQNLVTNNVGWARLGTIGDISLGYKLNKNFGIAALIRGQQNRFDTERLAVAYSNISAVPATVETAHWRIGAILAGSYGSFPVSKRLSVESRLMFGALLARAPELYVTYTYPGFGSLNVNQESATSTTLGYLIGIGMKYDVSSSICLLVNGDYFGGNAEFENVRIKMPDFIGMATNTFSQSFSSANVSAGIGFRL